MKETKETKETNKTYRQIIRENALIEYYENPNHCKQCGGVIGVRDRERISATRKRVFCSSACQSEFQSQKMIGNTIKKKKIKYCLNCGKELEKHQNKYCNNKCQQDFQYREYINKWKNGLVDGLSGEYNLSLNIKRYIREKYDNKCCECGWDRVNPVTEHSPLEIHHIDGDYKNNSEDNLVLLCPNCHSLTNTYKNALGHEGRQGRNKYYRNKEKIC